MTTQLNEEILTDKLTLLSKEYLGANGLQALNIYSMKVTPVCDIENPRAREHFYKTDSAFCGRHNSLPEAKKIKNVHLVPVLCEHGSHDEYLSELGFRLCSESASYLLGMMSKVHPNDLPKDLLGTNLVAYDKANFKNLKSSDPCYMVIQQKYITDRNKHKRNLLLLPNDTLSSLSADKYLWVLAEDVSAN